MINLNGNGSSNDKEMNLNNETLILSILEGLYKLVATIKR